MDKIICDVCGTSYPETSGQCPICGYVKPSRAKAAAQEESGYTYVKGGRFSNSNVKRRNLDKGMPASRTTDSKKTNRKNGSNMVLGIAAVVLLFAVIAGLIFFVSQVLDGSKGGSDKQTEGGSQTVQTSRDPDGQILCQELHTDTVAIELAEEGAKWVIHTTPVPADTTDSISYSSMDPDIATVDSTGTVTAVSGGETAITVRCGSAVLVITVDCSFVDESATWSMNRKDITLSKKGETWDLYSKSSTVPKNKITWTSDDETIAKIDGGIVEAVGAGVTKVHGEYNGMTYTCTIRCKLPEDETDKEDTDKETDGTEPAEGTEPEQETASVKISHTDVTLRPDGEENDKSFYLYLRDGNGNKLDVTWTPSHEGYVTIDGNKITAVKAGQIIAVTTTYEGVTYKCVIRLK